MSLISVFRVHFLSEYTDATYIVCGENKKNNSKKP